MKAVFVELPPFERYRSIYLDDDAYLMLQRLLILNPESGNVILVAVVYGSYAVRMNAVERANVVVFE